ncbi:MgtC/SapB family protein [Alkalimarinus coralli]|uniref:MgtC/SapB family protein n=1 Tax=Alkalimarinus coralli TaxID=2935863 RepID=UPI00202B4CA4|nr:MgtC/SapB family protein [Alkalimarinus coralli]
MNSEPEQLSPFLGLTISLLLGLLVGIQRGWINRNKASGERIAGIRTHALIGLLGGLCGLLANIFSELVLGLAFLSLSILITAAYLNSQRSHADMSITSLIGILLTFVFGALVVLGQPIIAASAAVVTVVILDNKHEIHTALQKLEEHELDAGLRLLLISVVMLPLLPNKGYGPWDAINPYEIWWMVVLIATISFVGYFSMKIGGPEKGIMFTSFFAGLSASTALTLHFSKLSKDQPALSPLLASGILAACGTMFPRILLVAGVINHDLLADLWMPVVMMMSCCYAPAVIIWRVNRHVVFEHPTVKQNPLELSSAFMFGLILLVIMLLSNGLQAWFGELGVLLLAVASGITDVDAITLTLSRDTANQLSVSTAVTGITLAAAVNSLVKGGMAATIGHRALAVRVMLPLLMAVVSGLTVAYLIYR